MLDKYKRIIGAVVGLYVGTLFGSNLLPYVGNYRTAVKQSEKPYYGPNLRQEWIGYAETELKELYNPKMLIPFSSQINQNPRPPELELRVLGGGNPDIHFKFDLGKENPPEENAPEREKPKRCLDDDINFI